MLLLSQKVQSQNCPDSPIIVGSTSLCDHGGKYEIINYNATFFASYQFQFFPGNSGTLTSFNTATGLFEVNWASLSQCSLVVSLAAPCQGADTIFMQNCCDGHGVNTRVDPEISQLPGALLSTSPGGGYSITGQTINIEGTVKVTSPLYLINCILNMGPGARIDVYKNSTTTNGALVLTGSTLRADPVCNTMWEGIRLFNNTEIKTEIGNFVTISGAQNAIAFYGNVGYHFQAPETRLWNNFRGVLVKPKYNSNIMLTKLAPSGGLFISGGNAFGPIPLPQNYVNGQLPLPINNTSYLGIDMLNCDQFEVDGSFGQSRNIITFLSYGIRLFDSNISVNETDFENIIANPNYVFNGTGSAVFANRISTTNNNTINFPGAANASLTNTIENCGFGINVKGSYNINVAGNLFLNIANDGVSVIRARNNSVLSIGEENRFTNCNRGVALTDCHFANISIINNIFTSTAPLIAGDFSNTAIYISNKSKVDIDYQIFENTITGYRLAIYSINCKRFSRGFNTIRYNQILFNRVVGAPFPNPQFTFMGVWLDFNEEIIVSNNIINYNQATVPANKIGLLRGFNIKDTKMAMVKSNTLNNVGMAMRFLADNRTLSLQCNVMDACGSGIFLDNAALSSQGLANAPWDNQWKNFGAKQRVYGAINPLITQIFWTYKNNNIDFNPTSTSPIAWLVPQIANFNGPCDNPTDPSGGDPERLIDFLLSIVTDTVLGANDSMDYVFRMRLFAYENLDENDSIRALLPEFMNFYAENMNTTISRLFNAERAVEELDYTTATVQLNSAICIETASQIIEFTLGVINDYDLYRNGSVDDIPFSVKDDLLAIANLPSSVYGVGVFYARAILEKEIDDIDLGLRIGQDSLIEISKNRIPRCFDLAGRLITCPDFNLKNIIKRKTANGDFIISDFK